MNQNDFLHLNNYKLKFFKMADQVNSQITDAVTQSNVKVVGEAPAMAMGNVYQSLAHSMGLLMENAVNQQQQLHTLQNAVTASAAKAMLASSPQEAVQMMNEVVKENNLTNSLKDLKELMNELKPPNK